MASGDPVKELSEELACPICLEYFKEPVTISCGHNYCQACLDQCWEGNEASCPQCREKVQKRDTKPNRLLANLVGTAKKLESQKAEEKGESLPEAPGAPEALLQGPRAPICVVCDRSKEHENHKVIPLDEASKEYKDQIWNLLKPLEKERKKILAYKANTENEIDKILKITQIQKEKTVAEYRRMHQFLEKQERNLLAKMEEAEKEIWEKRKEHLARLSEEISSLSKLIQEMEEKRQQPASELLQDIGSFFQGYPKREKCETPVVFPPALKWKIWDFRDIGFFLEGVMKQWRDSLESGLQQQKALVTLDPDTAYPRFILSEDRRRVTRREKWQCLPNNPERFIVDAYVLGQEGFTGGRHFGKSLWGSKGQWSVGIARESVERKGLEHCGPKTGIWEMGNFNIEYPFSSDNDEIPFPTLNEEPKRIRVTLNYEGGRVAFYDADSGNLIFEFPPVSFSGETLLPLFSVNWKAQLKLCP